MYKIRYRKKSNLELPINSFVERYKLLTEGNKKQILYIKHVFDNSTFRYRAYNVQQALIKSKKYEVDFFLSSEVDKMLPMMNKERVGMVILQRIYWDDDVQKIIDWCDLNGIPTVFDIDDYIYEPNCIPELFYSMNFSTNYEGGKLFGELVKQASLHYIAASRCKYMIATNRFLADCLEDFYGKKCFILPNFMNREQEEASKDAINRRKRKNGNFTIGYFSGSPSHQKDFEMISSELATILRNNENVDLKIVGYMKIPADLKEFKNRIKFSPFVSYTDLQYEIATVDINICPLFDSVFTDCKSDLKYFEAAAVNVPTIASPTFTYSQSIDHGINGFLCNQGEWHTVIQDIINGKYDLEKVAKKAHIHARDKYGIDNQLDNIENVFDDIINLAHAKK